ncbi:MAG TPA: amidohydrolase [Blastocatellia bacterium]|jgi:aminobenzoyl-glutamate utilization protein B|nr:amidohydrolase [Blastocatellia bacterium]
MKTVLRSLTLSILTAFSLFSSSPVAAIEIKNKEEAVASIEKRKAEMIKLSDQIWAYAETALREHKSSKALADYAERQGFKVERGVAGMPTAFVATYGQGQPVIGILGEFDALPGISQKASPVKEPLEAGAPGHGCGHNLFGVASLGAAIAVKELIAAGKLKGTIRFYGTPAEEAGSGKAYLTRDGLFNDLDVCLAWHPATETQADVDSTQALVDFIVEFKGKAAHAALDPWDGRSAVDGLEAFTHGVNLLREHVKPTVRMHYAIVKGGDVPNVVPEYAKVWCWARDSKRAGVEVVLQRLREIADGAARIAGVESKFTIQSGCYEILVNLSGAKLLQQNLEWLGPIKYTEQEQEFARAIQRATGTEQKGLNGEIKPLGNPKPDPPGGSTDVGDVSWVVPTLHLSVTTAPESAWHAWPVVACSGMSIGHKGMMLASKTLAATMVDLFEDAKAREAIQAEFKEKTKGFVYKPYVSDGPPPLPKE